MSVRAILGRPWREIPLSLRALVVLLLVQLPWLAVVSWNHPGLVAFLVAFFVLIAVLLLRGSRVVWVFLVASEAVGLLLVPWTGWGPWWGAVLGLGETALLVLPSSLRFVWRKRLRTSAIAPPEQEAGRESLDPDLPDGWYVDPDDPSRMRYWRAETGEWLGSTRTPRKIRREREGRS